MVNIKEKHRLPKGVSFFSFIRALWRIDEGKITHWIQTEIKISMCLIQNPSSNFLSSMKQVLPYFVFPTRFIARFLGGNELWPIRSKSSRLHSLLVLFLLLILNSDFEILKENSNSALNKLYAEWQHFIVLSAIFFYHSQTIHQIFTFSKSDSVI